MKLIFTEKNINNSKNAVKGGVNIFNNLFKLVSKNNSQAQKLFNNRKNNKNRYPVIKGSESKEYIKKMIKSH